MSEIYTNAKDHVPCYMKAIDLQRPSKENEDNVVFVDNKHYT